MGEIFSSIDSIIASFVPPVFIAFDCAVKVKCLLFSGTIIYGSWEISLKS